MRIYIASSWKNEPSVLLLGDWLREAGHEVDMFCDPSQGRHVFSFKDLEGHEKLDAITALQTPDFQRAFAEDKKWIDWSEVVVMLLPCGNSAHLEAGYAKGTGKKLFIVGDFWRGEFDVMYGFADGLYRPEEIPTMIEILSEGGTL